ncbi:MAG: SH3 domain-containing protein [Bacteroidetes bacterium]|nr:MAG: SH3 domain-containing protein [Bacteroidota bacterium]
MNNYEFALKLAGAEILIFNSFGSYQGDWWAKVKYKGKTGWVHGWYGSCSACDAFYAEFDFYREHECGEDIYYNPIYEMDFRENCEHCQKTKADLIGFGKKYLENILTYDEALKAASEDIEWDLEAEDMIKFIKEHKDA